jgi:hemolysin D
MKSSNAIIANPGALLRSTARAGRRGDEFAFLPAALEIVETPPSPIGRAIGTAIIAFFCVALAWACLGTVDIVASAPGKVIPSGRTKVIQPFEIGVVRAIHVHDGQSVKVGDILIELDPTMNDAERDHLQSDLIAAQLDVARLRAALAEGADPLAEFHPPAGASPALVATERQFLTDQIAEQHAKLAALDLQRAQKEAERTTSAAMIAKIQALIPLLQQQVDMHRTLYEHGNGSKLIYVQTLQALVEQQQEILVEKSHYREADAALASITATRAQAAAEYRRAIFDDLTKSEQKAAGFAQDLIMARERSKLQRLTAPVDGVVQQLAVHTLGGVVTAAQPLLVVVPVDSQLEVEAMVSNRDIGFVHAGQEVEIKVETFNFTRYGLLHGRVLSVSQDAVMRGNSQGQPNGQTQGPESMTSPTQAQDPVYMALVSLDRTQMQVEDKLVNLSPGMAVTAEIKTGSRRIIEYLLSPLRKYREEILRER